MLMWIIVNMQSRIEKERGYGLTLQTRSHEIYVREILIV